MWKRNRPGLCGVTEQENRRTAHESNSGAPDSACGGTEVVEAGTAEAFSNWVEQWSQKELKELQEQDVAIKRMLDLKVSGADKPKWAEIATEGADFKTLWAQWSVLEVSGGLLYRNWESEGSGGNLFAQLVLPAPLRSEILKELHHKRVGAHLGVTKVLAQVRKRFYWPMYKADVERWCRHCKICQQRKPGPGKGRAKLAQCPVGAPLERIAVDIMGPLSTTDGGNEYIMVLCDYFSKYTEAYAIPNHTAEVVADKLVTEFVTHFWSATAPSLCSLQSRSRVRVWAVPGAL